MICISDRCKRLGKKKKGVGVSFEGGRGRQFYLLKDDVVEKCDALYGNEDVPGSVSRDYCSIICIEEVTGGGKGLEIELRPVSSFSCVNGSCVTFQAHRTSL